MSSMERVTRPGSKRLPASCDSSQIACSTGQARLQGRSEVRASKTSAMATIRPTRGIAPPASWLG